VLAIARRILPPEPRGGEIPFGPVVPVPPDAGPYAQLAGWLGPSPRISGGDLTFYSCDRSRSAAW